MRKAEEPKISFIMVKYSGDKAAFKSFMNGMIHDYFDPDTMHNISQDDSVDKVEITAETE